MFDRQHRGRVAADLHRTAYALDAFAAREADPSTAQALRAEAAAAHRLAQAMAAEHAAHIAEHVVARADSFGLEPADHRGPRAGRSAAAAELPVAGLPAAEVPVAELVLEGCA